MASRAVLSDEQVRVRAELQSHAPALDTLPAGFGPDSELPDDALPAAAA